jgi:hypothetical protein
MRVDPIDAAGMTFDLRCIECGARSDLLARGWLAVRCDDPEHDEPPMLAFYCPHCARAEFEIDRHSRRADD